MAFLSGVGSFGHGEWVIGDSTGFVRRAFAGEKIAGNCGVEL